MSKFTDYVDRLEAVVLDLEEKSQRVNEYIEAYTKLRIAADKLIKAWPTKEGDDSNIPDYIMGELFEAVDECNEIDSEY
jgi:hypothetical protein